MSVPVLYEMRAAMLLGALVRAVDLFEGTINFYMDDEAWDALEAMQGASSEARAALIEAGYAHLLAGHVA